LAARGTPCREVPDISANADPYTPYATLEDQLTIEDPVRFSHPWIVLLRFSRVLDLTRFIPYECEADRNPIENGKLTIKPP
jgi:hypothetical protein